MILSSFSILSDHNFSKSPWTRVRMRCSAIETVLQLHDFLLPLLFKVDARLLHVRLPASLLADPWLALTQQCSLLSSSRAPHDRTSTSPSRRCRRPSATSSPSRHNWQCHPFLGDIVFLPFLVGRVADTTPSQSVARADQSVSEKELARDMLKPTG